MVFEELAAQILYMCKEVLVEGRKVMLSSYLLHMKRHGTSYAKDTIQNAAVSNIVLVDSHVA